MSDYLFTYGTLHPGHAPDEIAPAVEKLRPVGTGYVYGVLYDLGDYPGVVLDPTSNQKISGTVFRLSEDENVLRQLDEYEGFDQASPEQSLFLRTLRSVTLDSGETLPCWIYVYNRKT
ncbi:MAG: gamma-glutamylcyclotransferase family protein, partial [Terracidiphilus sp.]